MKSQLAQAISRINSQGMLLVFPEQNKKNPPSLWYEFYPRSKMRWEWDDSGDNRVAQLWHLREMLSTSRKVVYGKWYRGKATLMSFEVATAILRLMNPSFPNIRGLSFAAREILDLLEEDSPISTKQLKKLSGLQGRAAESMYTRALKELWTRQLVVAFGEVDEGGFPSIDIGSTKVIFEDQWQEAIKLSEVQAEEILAGKLHADSPFAKFLNSAQKKIALKFADPSEDDVSF